MSDINSQRRHYGTHGTSYGKINHMADSRHLIIQNAAFSGKAVVYVMSRDQRAHDNHALLAAQQVAQEHSVPLYVLFVLKKVAGRSREHYEFMLEGLKDVAATLATFNIPFVLRSGGPQSQIIPFCNETDAGALFFDFNPLIGVRNLVKSVAAEFDGPVTVVDTHNIIPAWVASDKQEFAAHTMRHKVHKNLEGYLVAPPELQKQSVDAPEVASDTFGQAKHFISDIPAAGINVSATPGESAALSHIQTFIDTDLQHYALRRNDVSVDHQSGLSPYLHFGHISSLRVALEVVTAAKETPLLFQITKLAEHGETPSMVDGMNALLEEMVVRKELADNFCLYNSAYKDLSSAPVWAQKSLGEHANDPRDFIYTIDQWESALTHDKIWNAAQVELTKSGKIHGYMRMYWAKKILEWSASPEEALNTAIYLNDKYSIDGGDPNGYVGILWSIAGLHDRPWFERPVFGKIRYMNESGLLRKFDVGAYIQRVQQM